MSSLHISPIPPAAAQHGAALHLDVELGSVLAAHAQVEDDGLLVRQVARDFRFKTVSASIGEGGSSTAVIIARRR